MVNEKLIEIINDLKNKRISDVEIIDILLSNNYTFDEIKENLKKYNETHGYSQENYIEKYEKLQGKKFFEEKITSLPSVKKEEKNIKVETKKEKVEDKKPLLKSGDLIAIIGIVFLLIIIVYIVLKYKIISF